MILRWWAGLCCALVLLAAPLDSTAGAIKLDAKSVGRGQPLVIQACPGKKAAHGTAGLAGAEAMLVPAKNGCLAGVLAPDLKVKPGVYTLKVSTPGAKTVSRKVKITDMDYGTRRITVKARFMKLSKEQLDRHWKEMARQKAVYALRTPHQYWRGAFERPEGKVVGNFGRKSVINGKPRSPHGGTDFRAALGDPVRAAAAGKVALVDDTYFGGLIVMIDHGLGVVSTYRHLSKSLVKKGQMVIKGQLIAKAGKSGRVTGPHLHFDIHLAGSRVDPLAFIQASRELAALTGK